MSGDPSGSCSPKTFLLTDFVGGGGAAVVLAEEGVDQAQLREAVLAKAAIWKEARKCMRITYDTLVLD